MKSGYETCVIFATDGPAIQAFRQSDVTVYTLTHLSWLRRKPLVEFVYDFIREWRRKKRFAELISQVQPDLVYINTSVSIAAAIAAKHSDIPCIWHIRELFSEVGGEMQAPEFLKPTIARFFRYFSSTLVVPANIVSHCMLKQSARCHSIPVHTVPNGIPASFFSENQTSNSTISDVASKNEESLVIGFPGTLRPVKGHFFFLRAIAPILHQRADLRVLITGDGTGTFKREMVELISSLGIREQVRAIGTIEDMPAFYRSCDIICVPSASESFGRTVVEAMASQRPLLASAVGGIKEIIDDRLNGLLFDYGDEEAFRSALTELLENKVMREKLAKAARKKAWEQYREETYKQRLITIIEETLAGAK